MNAFEEIYIRIRDRYHGFRKEDVSKLLKRIVGFDFAGWSQYGTGNKAEVTAGEDLRQEIAGASESQDQSKDNFPL
jgi:hypothetical protein